MNFIFFHKDNHYTVLNDEAPSFLEEVPQLERQGFVNYSKTGIKADSVEHAKFLYLRKMVFGITSEYVFCLYIETGKEIWRVKPKDGKGMVSNSSISLVLHNDKILLGAYGQTLCLCAFTGLELWINPLPGVGSEPIRLFSPS